MATKQATIVTYRPLSFAYASRSSPAQSIFVLLLWDIPLRGGGECDGTGLVVMLVVVVMLLLLLVMLLFLLVVVVVVVVSDIV